MLILTRRFGESIYIGDDIKITIMHGNCMSQVRVGIKAPDDIAIHRDEIYRQILNDQQELLRWQKKE